MIFEENKLKVLLVVIGLVTMGVSTYYFANILSPQLEKIKWLKETNEIKKTQILKLEEKIKDLPQMRQDLMDFNLEIKALKNKIPHHKNATTMMMEILKVMDALKFENTQVMMGEPTQRESHTSPYNIIPMTIEYTTTYYNAANLLEKMSRSYNMVTIDLFSIDNSIQDEKDGQGNKIVSGEHVTAQMLLSLHYIGEEKEEEYPNFMEFLNKNDQVFLKSSKEEIVESH